MKKNVTMNKNNRFEFSFAKNHSKDGLLIKSNLNYVFLKKLSSNRFTKSLT